MNFKKVKIILIFLAPGRLTFTAVLPHFGYPRKGLVNLTLSHTDTQRALRGCFSFKHRQEAGTGKSHSGFAVSKQGANTMFACRQRTGCSDFLHQRAGV
jgi:hypothetical protein